MTVTLRRIAAAVALAPALGSAQAPGTISDCTAIEDDAARLACYDQAAGRARPRANAAPSSAGASVPAPKPEPSLLRSYWGLDSSTSDSFLLWPHKPTFISPLRYSDRVNAAPGSDAEPNAEANGYRHAEVQFQLSLKFRPLRGRLGERTELWLAYTQQSHWQLYDPRSSPFRETNYEPELFLTFPLEPAPEFLGLTLRGVNLGVVHQSNGQGGALSRSWNRVYAQVGFDRDRFALLVKPWWRIPEDREDDDNPDISDYVGRAEVLAVYKPGVHAFSLLVRNNLRARDNRGAVEAQWSTPVPGLRTLRLYTKLFSGYGETLIDYNFRQTSVSVGFLLTDWVEPPLASKDQPKLPAR